MTTPAARAAPRPDPIRPDSVQDAKQALRRALRQAWPTGRTEAGAALAGHLLAAGILPEAARVAGFWPMPHEIDLRPLLHALHARGQVMLLPFTPPPGERLRFRSWHPGAAMRTGRFGAWHPAEKAANGREIRPDIVLTPLLAFDRAGNRLGHGGGYYDRTLAALPGALAIGCGFACQERTGLPVGPHDVKLRMVATEAGLIRCGDADRES